MSRPAIRRLAAAGVFASSMAVRAGVLGAMSITRAPYDRVSTAEHGVAAMFVGRKPENPITDDLPSTRAWPGSCVLFHRDSSPDLSDEVLFVRDRGEHDEDLLAHVPGRVAYRLRMRGFRRAHSNCTALSSARSRPNERRLRAARDLWLSRPGAG